jgi:pimeloyl-ACP methyl ester carboxylesterase
MDPLVARLDTAGHSSVVVDLHCDDPAATLEDYASAARGALPDDITDVVLVGYSFGGFTASTIAAEHPDLPMVYIAAWIPAPGVSVIELFAGGDPFVEGEEAGLAAFGGLILSGGPGLCALNIDAYVSALEADEQATARAYLERTQRPQGIAVLRQPWQGQLRTTGTTYIHTTGDTLVPPEAQLRMAASVGARVVPIDTDHGPFRERPERLAELVLAAARPT